MIIITSIEDDHEDETRPRQNLLGWLFSLLGKTLNLFQPNEEK